MCLLKQASLCLMLCLSSSTGKIFLFESWKGIIPLHSTREDVEKKLGVKSSGKSFDVFKLDTEQVMIVYSVKPCESDFEKWKVPIGTVLELVVIPKAQPLFSEVKIDASKYKRSFSPKTDVDVVTYTDEDSGHSIEFTDERVSNYRYRPAKKDDSLLCSSNTSLDKNKSNY
ncbi:MAG: hypothetical protein SF097_03725 [Acidobacteriota bacterium]|nr:hypothetical protein [Acidobacteriota bacterium]